MSRETAARDVLLVILGLNLKERPKIGSARRLSFYLPTVSSTDMSKHAKELREKPHNPWQLMCMQTTYGQYLLGEASRVRRKLATMFLQLLGSRSVTFLLGNPIAISASRTARPS